MWKVTTQTILLDDVVVNESLSPRVLGQYMKRIARARRSAVAWDRRSDRTGQV